MSRAMRDRTCRKCGAEERAQPDAFYAHRKVSRCKACHKAANDAYDAANPEKVRERQKRALARLKEKKRPRREAYEARCAASRAAIEAAGSAFAAGYRQNLPTYLLCSARKRARRYGIPFAITKADVVVPERCSILGIPLKLTAGPQTFASPTLDKVFPELGYVPGNVRVISMRANIMKGDASAEEHLAIARYIESNRTSLQDYPGLQSVGEPGPGGSISEIRDRAL